MPERKLTIRERKNSIPKVPAPAGFPVMPGAVPDLTIL